MPDSPEGQGQFSGALTPYPALPMHYPASILGEVAASFKASSPVKNCGCAF